MTYLPDRVLDRLREAAEEPDLTGTKYELIARVAAGGMGTVFLVRDTVLNRRTALKVANATEPEDGLSGGLRIRMMREAQILARLEHPGIVPVHDVGILADGRPFCVMKFVEGVTLDYFAKGDAGIAERLRIFQKACETVAFAHEHGVVHRDLKPENIMVGAFGEVLVLDWGIAKYLDGDRDPSCSEARDSPSGSKTGCGVVLGTPAYMAPEQETGEPESVDARADVYSLGQILRHLIRSPMPPSLRAVCCKATAQHKGDRYANAQELADDVIRYLDGVAVSAYRENWVERCARWGNRNRTLLLLVAAYLVMRLVVWLIAGR